jgi:hypothetical protein
VQPLNHSSAGPGVMMPVHPGGKKPPRAPYSRLRRGPKTPRPYPHPARRGNLPSSLSAIRVPGSAGHEKDNGRASAWFGARRRPARHGGHQLGIFCRRSPTSGIVTAMPVITRTVSARNGVENGKFRADSEELPKTRVAVSALFSKLFVAMPRGGTLHY